MRRSSKMSRSWPNIRNFPLKVVSRWATESHSIASDPEPKEKQKPIPSVPSARLYSASRKYHVTFARDFQVMLRPHYLVMFGLMGLGTARLRHMSSKMPKKGRRTWPNEVTWFLRTLGMVAVSLSSIRSWDSIRPCLFLSFGRPLLNTPVTNSL